MMPIAPELSLIFPCYNAGSFLLRNLDLVAGFFKTAAPCFECLVIDDGSTDGTAAMLQEACQTRPWLRLLIQPENRGKGMAVRRGLREAKGRYAVMNDIDLQYDLADMCLCYQTLRRSDADLAIGSRLHPDSLFHIHSRQLRYIFTRHVFSRFMNLVIRNSMLPDVFDTQCGLKGFSRHFIEVMRNADLIINGFAFDIELLVLANEHGLSMVEIPVQFHYDDIPSTVNFIRAGTRVLRDIIRIVARRQAGKYRPRDSANQARKT